MDHIDTYKLMVDFCKKNKIIDYETKKPLFCYTNRDKFCQFLNENVIINDSPTNNNLFNVNLPLLKS